ncbi:MAG: RagB/SusD family nutrient uptake outer membrane protein [Cyclobacteriaceae bacterium]|jgi:hypothetical protein
MKRQFIALLALLIVQSACQDVVEQDIIGERTTDTYWNNQADLDDALAGTYSPFATRALGMHDLFFDNQGDDHWRAGDHEEDTQIELFNTTTTNYKLEDTYKYKYEVINNANNIIAYGPQVLEAGNIDQEAYDNILGQAYFLRAYAYYRLFVIHGRVPIITEENVLDLEFNIPKCETTTELTNFILRDLDQAAGLLPLRNDAGKVNQGAAWALMVKTYMHRAQQYDDVDNLNRAISAGEQVIANYALAEDYLSLFRSGNENLEENLFLMMNDMSWINERLMSKHRGPRPWGMYGFQEPLDDLVNEYEEGDLRKAVTIVSDGDTVNKGGEQVVHSSELSNTGHSYFKYMDWIDPGTFNHGLNIPFLRAAETYLLVAEAKIRLNGAGAGDAEINAVRSRAGLATVSNADIYALAHESRVELAGENCRYQNLLRWDKAGVYDLTEFLSRPEKMYYADESFKIWERPRNYYQPLYQGDIDNSNGVLEQYQAWN